MLIQKENIEKIRDNFGLNHYEIKIWTALLSRRIAAASDLADLSGVPRSRCYDVLESLEKKGFTIMKIGKPIKYIAIKPEEILERIKKNIQQESYINLKLLETIRVSEIFHELELLHKTGIEHIDPEEITDTFLGRSEINRHIKKITDSAKKSVIIASTKEGFERKLRVLKNILPAKINSGLKAKFVVPADYKGIKDYEGKVKIKFGITNLRFIIVDNNETFMFLTPENTAPESEMAILIKSEFFSNTLIEMYTC